MQPRRQHLLDTAYQLFNQYGYHATGIDRVLAVAGVSKATLYKYFRSKEELILAVLQQRHEAVLAQMHAHMAVAEAEGSSPTLALFDGLHEWFNSAHFFGCNFINASAEYSGVDDPIRAFASQHKQRVTQLVRDSLGARAQTQPELADALALLLDGAIVMAHTRGDKNAAQLARHIASQLLSAG